MIRSAVQGDAAGIAVVEAAGASGPWPEAEIRRTLDQVTSQALVAEVDGTIVGHILGRLVGGEAEVLTIAVMPGHRRRGIGGRLLRTCLAHWKQASAEAAFLEVRADNGGAIAMYAAAGWRPNGTRPGYYRDGTDALCMRLDPQC
jgi:ribosomal-protein-alanine N-acetyltransferase